MGVPLKFHWYWSWVPEASTQNTALAPRLADMDTGATPMLGAAVLLTVTGPVVP